MTKQSDILNDPGYKPVLDNGFVGLVDHMGDDASIVQAARVSYGAGTKAVSQDRALIRYLLRHRHTTPFEMVEFKFHVRAPILVIRQWQRHRTASINEESARYSEMQDEFYLPEPEFIQPQSADNKQGRSGDLSPDDQEQAQHIMADLYSSAYAGYKTLLGDVQAGELSPSFSGIAREIARSVMPVGAYSEFYWKLNLHNLFHFLKLRADPHAQFEIRVFAEAIIELARPHCPLAFEAFQDYVREAHTLSRMDKALLIDALGCGSDPKAYLDQLEQAAGGAKTFAAERGMSLREYREFRQTFAL